MKRNKQNSTPAASAPLQGSAAPAFWEGPVPETVKICLFSALLLAAMTVQTGRMSVILMALALAASVGRGPLRRLRQRLCVPVLALLAYALMNGAAAIYAAFGDYAVGEFYKIAASFSVAVLLLTRFDGKNVRGLLWGFAAVSAVIGLACLDAAAEGPFFSFFNTLTTAAGHSYQHIPQDQTARLVGIYHDANVSGSILGLGSLVSLYLAHSGKAPWKRLAACFLLGISAQVFFLSMSRGAILCFGLALLVWLAAERKEERPALFFLMTVSAAVTVAVSVAIMPVISTEAVRPLALTLVSGLLIFPLDMLISQRLGRLLAGRGRAVALSLLAVTVICACYIFIGLQITEPFTFRGQGDLGMSRSVVLDAGTYTFSGDWDGGDNALVSVYTRTPEQAMMSQSTSLYNGSISGAEFTLEERTRVYLYFRGSRVEGGQLRQVSLSDGTEIPMAYKILPSFLVDRLHRGVLTSYSFLGRIQFMKDACKIIAKNPVLGHGLGATEGLYTSVQPFFYESLYVHNHILQSMTDMGIFGAAFLLGVAGGSLWLILRRLREERDPLAAALLAVWVMINAHSLMEINFSIRAYQCAAWLLLLCPVLLWGRPLSAGGAVKWGGWAVSVFLWGYLLVFGGLLMSHRMVMREAEDFSSRNVRTFLDGLRDFTRRDVFDHETYQLTYVRHAVQLNDSGYNRDMRRYVEELRRSGTYTACSGLAWDYYLPRGEFEELFACSREGIAQEASVSDAWNQQLDFYREAVLPAAGPEHMDEFVNGVRELEAYLERYSQGRMEEIRLTEENRSFLDGLAAAREAGMSGQALYVYLTMVLNSAQPES